MARERGGVREEAVQSARTRAALKEIGNGARRRRNGVGQRRRREEGCHHRRPRRAALDVADCRHVMKETPAHGVLDDASARWR